MTPTADILVKEHRLPWGRRTFTFEWVGPATGVVEMDWDAWERFYKGKLPWPLRVVAEDLLAAKVYVARVDEPYHLSWAYHATRAWLQRTLGLLWARCILTLMVWGLAWVPEGEIPSRKHIGRKRGF